MIYGSEANNSAKWRRGLTIRYIPTSTRILSENTWVGAFWLQGEIVPGVNVYNPYPAYVEGRDMPFHDSDAWNRQVEAHNQKLREAQA